MIARMSRVGFFPRTAAFMIDLGAFLVFAHFFVWLDVMLNGSSGLNAFGPVSLGGGSVFLAVYSLLDVFGSGTPGKHAMGLVVAGEDGHPAPRRALLGRWAVKFFPVAVLATAGALLSMTLTSYPTVHFSEYVRDGITVVGFADAVIGLALAAFVVLGCFRVARPGSGRQAFHDVMSHTAVFSAAELRKGHAFEPVFAVRADESAEPAERA
jgi:hypothetical protein